MWFKIDLNCGGGETKATPTVYILLDKQHFQQS